MKINPLNVTVNVQRTNVRTRRTYAALGVRAISWSREISLVYPDLEAFFLLEMIGVTGGEILSTKRVRGTRFG